MIKRAMLIQKSNKAYNKLYLKGQQLNIDNDVALCETDLILPLKVKNLNDNDIELLARATANGQPAKHEVLGSNWSSRRYLHGKK